jgi:hypothetical protein
MTPEDRIRMARGGAGIKAPITAREAAANYQAAGLDPDTAAMIAHSEQQVHGPDAHGIWSQPVSPSSVARVQDVQGRQKGLDMLAQAAKAEPYQGRGLSAPGEERGVAGGLPADRAVGTGRLLAQREQQKAETSARIAQENKSWNEWDKRQEEKRKARNAQIDAMAPSDRRAYADRAIRGGTQNQFGVSDRERSVDRNRVLTQAWQKYAKVSGLDFSAFENAYDNALRETGSHAKASLALSAFVNPLKIDLARQNYETGRQRAKDYNLSRETGRPIADVMFGNALRNAKTDREREDVLLEHGLPGHGNLAAISTKGRQEIAAVEAAGGGRGPQDPTGMAMAGARSAGAGQLGQEIAAAQAHAVAMTSKMGAEAPVMRDQIIATTLMPRAAEVASQPGNHSPEQIALLQTWTRSAMADAQPHLTPYRRFIHWCGKLNVDPNDPNTKLLFSKVTQLDPKPRWGEARWANTTSQIPDSVVAAPPMAAADVPRGDL